jgi:hypothetical protein
MELFDLVKNLGGIITLQIDKYNFPEPYAEGIRKGTPNSQYGI